MCEYIEKSELLSAIKESDGDVMADFGDYCEWGFSRKKLYEIIQEIEQSRKKIPSKAASGSQNVWKWSDEKLDDMSSLEFAARILNEQKEKLAPSTRFYRKLDDAADFILEIDKYSQEIPDTGFSVEKTVELLYRDGYHSAARLLEKMLAEIAANRSVYKTNDNGVV